MKEYIKKYHINNKEKIEEQRKYRKENPLSENERRKPLSKKHKENISKTLKGRTPWNKNLTKEIDERVAKIGRNVNKALKGKKKPPRSKEHKINLSKTRIKAWQDPEYRKKMSEAHKGEEWTLERRRNASKAKIGIMPKNLQYPRKWGNVKNGYYDINSKNIFFRSKWEANYALYLDFLIKQKQIQKWTYEEDVFIFEKIKFGTRSYRPDFKIYNIDGSIEYHEVKGYMDSKSKTKIKRMAKYYPNIKLIIIDSDIYKDLKKKLGKLLKFYQMYYIIKCLEDLIKIIL